MAKVSEISAVLGVTAARIGQLVNTGVLPRVERGEYNTLACAKAYIRYLQRLLEDRTDPIARKDVAALRREAAALKRVQRKRAEIELRERCGDLLLRADVAEVWADICIAIRSKMRGLPTKLAPRLVDIAEPAAIEAAMRAGIDEALTELADAEAVVAQAHRKRHPATEAPGPEKPQ